MCMWNVYVMHSVNKIFFHAVKWLCEGQMSKNGSTSMLMVLWRVANDVEASFHHAS